MCIALAAPGPLELILILLVFGFPVVVLGIALRMSRRNREDRRHGFPMATLAEPDGPGEYRVAGVDKQSRADRTISVQAGSRANAQIKAELDGIVVTDVTKVS